MTGPESSDRKDLYVAVLGGTDDVVGIERDRSQNTDIEGNNDIWRLMSDDVGWARCHIGPSYFRQGRRWDFSRASVILNLISDPDQNPKTLRVAERITARFRDRIINDPRHIRATRRDDIARKLRDIEHLRVPKVLRLRKPTLDRLRSRMKAEDFRFPAIVRRTGTQTGKILGLFQTAEDVAPMIDGDPEEFYFTEFVDNRFADGLYRKMRLVQIGDETLLNHYFISESWNIHGHMARSGIMKERADLREEERRHFEDRGDAAAAMERARVIMREIARRTKLDYIGMDCSPTEDGEFVLFEANATMNIMPRSDDPLYNYAYAGRDERGTSALEKLLRNRSKPFRRLSSKAG